MENVLAIDVFVQPHPPLSHPPFTNVFLSSLHDLVSGPVRQRRHGVGGRALSLVVIMTITTIIKAMHVIDSKYFTLNPLW